LDSPTAAVITGQAGLTMLDSLTATITGQVKSSTTTTITGKFKNLSNILIKGQIVKLEMTVFKLCSVL